LWADYQGHTLRGERMPSIHAGDDQRDLNAQSRAAARRLGCQYLHLTPPTR